MLSSSVWFVIVVYTFVEVVNDLEWWSAIVYVVVVIEDIWESVQNRGPRDDIS